MAARMISLLRFKGRRVTVLVSLGAACLIVSALFCDGLNCAVGCLLRPWAAVLPPDGLNSRTPMLSCPPYRGETSTTLGGVLTRQPITPEHHERRMGDVATYGRVPRPMRSRDGGHDASPTEETRVAPAHTHRSKSDGPTSAASRPRGAGTKP